LEQLNERNTGTAIFFVPGAGLQAGSFRALAAMLPVPAYGFSWNKGARTRSEWPASLTELAKLFLQEIVSIQPEGPYCLAGHSFGATVCLEMARLLEAKGQGALVSLLDPRHLLPVEADVAQAFGALGSAENLALLSQTAADGSRFTEKVEEISKLPAEERDAAVKKSMPAAAVALLDHVQETNIWYAELLGKAADAAPMADASPRGPRAMSLLQPIHPAFAGAAKAGGSSSNLSAMLSSRVVLFRAEDVREREGQLTASTAERLVREFQEKTFQSDSEVASRIKSRLGGGDLEVIQVRGTHFSMLHEAQALSLALKVCRSLDEWSEQAKA
jgi:thioesterase domain-containing protein